MFAWKVPVFDSRVPAFDRQDPRLLVRRTLVRGLPLRRWLLPLRLPGRLSCRGCALGVGEPWASWQLLAAGPRSWAQKAYATLSNSWRTVERERPCLIRERPFLVPVLDRKVPVLESARVSLGSARV